jgi:glutamyl-tRNA reductase
MSVLSTTYHSSLNNFCIAGINYRKSDMTIRGKFSLSSHQSLELLQEALAQKIGGCLVLSTCNRSEVYGLCNDPQELVELFCRNTNTSESDFLKHNYIYHGLDAIRHLFKVASGLDSQIVGDYEILSQLKQSIQISREVGCMNSFMERAINYSLQVSKEIKTKTKLSTGTVSVSYAAIEIIKERVEQIAGKNILLIGTGKFGNHIAKNLQNYLPGAQISFMNRTNAKASELAKFYDANFVSYQDLASACDEADIIITSSAARSYTVVPKFFKSLKPRLILDLSVPQNVDPAVKDLQEMTVLNVDEVSSILDRTISKRKAEIPKAMKIIDDTINSLEEWHKYQANNSSINQVKSQLYKINELYFHNHDNQEQIHKAVSALAIELKHKNNKGCQCINALNGYLQGNYETS